MKSADVKSSTYFDSSKENNDKNHKFKIGENLKLSKYKKIFANCYTTKYCSMDLCY